MSQAEIVLGCALLWLVCVQLISCHSVEVSMDVRPVFPEGYSASKGELRTGHSWAFDVKIKSVFV